MSRRTRMLLVLAISTMLVLGISGVCAAAPSGTTMSNELQSEITAEDVSGVQLSIDHQTDLVLGMYDEFGLYIDSLGDYTNNELVRGRVKLIDAPDSAAAGDIEVKYLGQTAGNEEYGKFLPLAGDDVTSGWAYFGSTDGFPLPETTPYGPSIFRLEVASDAPAGTYQFQVEMVTADAEEVVVSEPLEVSFVVSTGNAVSLSSGEGILAGDTTVTVGAEQTGSVTADLTDSVSHLDHAVHLIDVEKSDGGWVAAAEGDFTISEPGEGFSNTFDTVDGVLRGWWGPAETGFLLADEATTSFNVTFNVSGTYRVRVYTIQKDPYDYGSDNMTDDLPDYWNQHVLSQ